MTGDNERSARLEAMLAGFERKLKQTPDSVYLLFQRAQVLALLGRDEDARTGYLAGRMPRKRYADPSSPLTGLI